MLALVFELGNQESREKYPVYGFMDSLCKPGQKFTRSACAIRSSPFPR
jgi:hypothetical protein